MHGCALDGIGAAILMEGWMVDGGEVGYTTVGKAVGFTRSCGIF